MKPLFILLKIVIVGLCWSIFFIEGVRVILLTNWHFDIFRTAHWRHAWNLWTSGWVIDAPKEWAFILIIFTAVPVWITVWAALSSIHWKKIFTTLSAIPLKFISKFLGNQVTKITNTAAVKVVKKKKSYKEIRPNSIRPPLDSAPSGGAVFDEERRAALSGVPYKPKPRPAVAPVAAEPKEFSHSLFDLGDSEPIDFDLFGDLETEEQASPVQQNKPSYSKKESSRPSQPRKKSFENQNDSLGQTKHKTGSVNSTFEILKQKGYEIITGATIQNTFIDFIGVSKSQICLCLNDKEPGDWLADEERFNDEEPLWFSESSHRISPVRKVDLARLTLRQKLEDSDLSFEIVPFVIEQIGNIINAEDMFDIWKEMSVNVTRIDRGTPKEIPLFAKTLEESDGTIDKAVLEKIKKLLRNIA